MRTFIATILRFRWLTLVLIAVVTGISGYILSQAAFGTDIDKLFFSNNPAHERYVGLAKRFGSDELSVFAFSTEGLLSPDGLARLDRALEDLADLDYVAHVDSIATAQHISEQDDILEVESYLSLMIEQPERMEALLDELQTDPMYGGLFLSQDRSAMAVVVEMAQGRDKDAEVGPQQIEGMRQVFVAEGLDRIPPGDPDGAERRFYIAGNAPMLAECIALGYQTLGVLLPATVTLLITITFLLFGRLWPVFVTGLVAIVGTIWAMAFGLILDPEINIIMAMAPAIILIVSFSDVIHLYSAYTLELRNGLSKEEAILLSGEEVGRACLFTSLTTFVGFASMAFVPTPVFRMLGLTCGFGVGVALLLAVTMGPILFSLFPTPAVEATGLEKRMLRIQDTIVDFCHRVSMARPWVTLALTGAISVIIFYGLNILYIDTNLGERLAPSNPVRQSEVFLQANFPGIHYIETYVTAPGENGIIEPEALAALQALNEEITATYPDIDQSVSITDVMGELHETLGGQGVSGKLPDTRALAAQYLLLFEMSGGEDLERFLSHDRSMTRVTYRSDMADLRRLAATADEIQQKAEARLPEGFSVETTGIAVLVGGWIGNILKGQQDGLLFACISIAIMMVVALRSLRIGLWSMVPNILPLFALGGMLGLVYGQVDSDALMVVMIAIGIGVDDTVHFLSRFKIAYAKVKDNTEALHETFHFAGRAILQTTVVLVLGFIPFAMSDYLSTSMFGIFLPFTLVVALVADLFVVPAMVEVGLIRYE